MNIQHNILDFKFQKDKIIQYSKIGKIKEIRKMKKYIAKSETLSALYYWMFILRKFEQRAKDLYRQGIVKGALHLYIGEEAVAVGVCSALRDDDFIFSTHRSHGHYLAKTHDPEGAMAELLGRASGCSRGHGGSMHMFNRAKGFMGSNGIVGGGIPLAMGAAFARKYEGKDSIAAAFFGDGAANQGILHETLNMCAVGRYPFLAVCENNGVAATTLTETVTADTDRRKLAAAYGIPSEAADGNDAEAVAAAAARAVAFIRSGKGPFLLDLKTYRMEPHCGIIKDTRDRKLHCDWTENRDPLKTLVRKHPDIFRPCVIAGLEAEAGARIEKVIEAALAAPMPDVELFRRNFGV